MIINRRHFLGAALALAVPLRVARAQGARVLIVGASWGGLAAARELRRLAPELDVVVVDALGHFVPLPSLNPWLMGRSEAFTQRPALADLARRDGFRFVQGAVEAIDRTRGEVRTAQTVIPYDWLILAPGIREDWLALSSGDPALAAQLQARWDGGFRPGADFVALGQRVAAFAGGNFLITVPPAPYRCPPAPYERAIQLATRFRQRGLRFQIVLVDPNPPWTGYQRVFREAFPDEIRYFPQTRLHQLDPAARRAVLDVDEIAFAEAMVLPPQAAGSVCALAGVLAPDANGQPTGWAAVNPESLQSLADPRILVVGDALGRVSPLFGHFPKTGQMALLQGQMAARQVAALARGGSALAELPQSTCFSYLNMAPEELVEIRSRYTRRGDGVLVQQLQQQRISQPGGEAEAWLAQLYQQLLGQPLGG